MSLSDLHEMAGLKIGLKRHCLPGRHTVDQLILVVLFQVMVTKLLACAQSRFKVSVKDF